MKSVYESNPSMGDASTLDGQLRDSAVKLEKLSSELNKFQTYLAEFEAMLSAKPATPTNSLRSNSSRLRATPTTPSQSNGGQSSRSSRVSLSNTESDGASVLSRSASDTSMATNSTLQPPNSVTPTNEDIDDQADHSKTSSTTETPPPIRSQPPRLTTPSSGYISHNGSNPLTLNTSTPLSSLFNGKGLTNLRSGTASPQSSTGSSTSTIPASDTSKNIGTNGPTNATADSSGISSPSSTQLKSNLNSTIAANAAARSQFFKLPTSSSTRGGPSLVEKLRSVNQGESKADSPPQVSPGISHSGDSRPAPAIPNSASNIPTINSPRDKSG